MLDEPKHLVGYGQSLHGTARGITADIVVSGDQNHPALIAIEKSIA